MFLVADILEKSKRLCAVVALVLQNKIPPVAQAQSLDEENYFRVLQHPKT
jgi:hypothetical protein